MAPLLAVHGYCDNVGDLSNRNLFSNSSTGSTSKVTVSAGLVSPETFLLGLQMVAFLLGLHAVAPRSVSSSPLLTRTRVILNKAHPYDLILPYLPLYRPCPKYSHMLQTKGLGLKCMNLEGGIVQPITAPHQTVQLTTGLTSWSCGFFFFFFFFYLRKLKIVPKPLIMSIKRLCGFLYNLTVLAPVRDNKSPSFCYPSLYHASTFSYICPPPIVSGKENLLYARCLCV